MTTTTAPVLSRKLQHMFRILDSDQDGYLEVQDMSARAEALAAPFAAPPERVQALSRSLQHIWDEYLQQMDKDGDGKLTSAEYEQGFRAAIDRDSSALVDSLYNTVTAWFDLFDVDREGHLSYDEYAKMTQGMGGIAQAEMKKAFGRLDHDNDGRLRPEEVRTAVVEFFTSEDPDADGNWLYGPL